MQYGLKYSGTRFFSIENSTELLYFLMDVSACFKTGNYFEWKNTTIFGLRGNTLLVYLHNFSGHTSPYPITADLTSSRFFVR